MYTKQIPKRYFVIDYDADDDVMQYDLKEVTEAEFNEAEGSITVEHNTMWANGVDQICYMKGLDVC
jgi:hypothetical protein